jgi:hypothetical protein
VFVDVHVDGGFAAVAPCFIAGDAETAFDGGLAFGAEDVVGVFVFAVGGLAAADGGEDTVRVFVDDAEVVEDVVAFSAFEGNLAAAIAVAGDGVLVEEGPADLVDGVDGLFDETVAAEP